MYDRSILGLKEAQGAIEVMIQEVESGKPDYWGYGSFAVVDYQGDLITFARMDRTGKHGLDMAIRKAYSAAIWGQTTSKLLEYIQDRPWDLSWFGDYAAVTGGVPIIPPGIPEHIYMMPYTVGAIGVANVGHAIIDENVAMIGVNYIRNILWPSK